MLTGSVKALTLTLSQAPGVYRCSLGGSWGLDFYFLADAIGEEPLIKRNIRCLEPLINTP